MNNSTNRTWFPPSPTYFNYSKTIIPIAGKPIVHRLVEDIAKILDEPIDEIAFILGDPAFEMIL
jgi:glucose-1-phosphate thymidylyltransferase